MNIKWHLRARAVIYRDGKFLVVHPKGGDYIFLIGGHVEEGESVPVALEREIMEEARRKAEAKEYLGAIENAWMEEGARQWEITHFFNVKITDIETHPDIIPAEEGFDLIWVTPDEFGKLNLLPTPLRGFMKNWAAGDRGIWWASAMD